MNFEQLNLFSEIKTASPILQWMGGKKRLFQEIYSRFPNNFNNYFEPFIGGGYISFKLGLKNTVINDLNFEIYNLYCCIKLCKNDLIKETVEIRKKWPKSLKDQKLFFEQNKIERNAIYKFNSVNCMLSPRLAALTLYLNRTSFNSLYRINQDGEYTSSWDQGNFKSYRFDLTQEINDLHNLFIDNNFKIANDDYKNIFWRIKENDFVYLDPPYDEADTMYLGKWNFEKQKELKDELDKLTARKVKWMLSNSNTENIKNLYANYKIEEVEIKSNLSQNLENRKTIKELLIRNYD